MADHPVTEPEEWRPVPGHPGYEASSFGRVRSVDRWITYSNGYTRLHPGVLLRASISGRYLIVRLAPGGSVAIHRIVCMAFHGPRPSKSHHAAHWNGDGNDNRAANLRWATPRQNKADQFRHGRAVRGAVHHRAKVTEEDVATIRRLRAVNGEQFQDIAARYGISNSQACAIANGKSWKHIP